jgi:hypothetical protein
MHSLGLPFTKTGDFKQDRSRSNDGDPMIHWALTLTHSGFCRVLRNRLVWKDPDPNARATLRGPGNGRSASLNLRAGNPCCFHGLDAIVSEHDILAAIGFASSLSAESLPMLGSSWE